MMLTIDELMKYRSKWKKAMMGRSVKRDGTWDGNCMRRTQLYMYFY